jgi:hypothetical protein
MRHTLLALCLALGLATPAQADVAVVQSNCVASNPFVTDGIADLTLAGNATIGNYLIVAFSVPASSRTVSSVAQGATGLTLMTDGVQAATQEASGAEEQWAYSVVVASASTAVTVTLSSAVATGGQVCAIELSGQHATTPIEDVAVAQNSGTSHDTGNVTTANAGSLLFGYINGSSGDYNEDADFTTLTSAETTNHISGYDLVGAVTASYTPTTAGTEQTLQMVIAIAPAGGGGGGGSTQKRRMMGLLP